jgi:hypothetical protein
MLTKKRLLFAGLLILFVSFCAFAQYTGFDLEGKRPPSLYPEVGRGEQQIVDQLQQTNQLLLRNNQLLADQNRLLRDLLQNKRRR